MVFIPKKRQNRIYGAIRKHLGVTFHELAKRKDVTTEEGHPNSGQAHHHSGAQAVSVGQSGIQWTYRQRNLETCSMSAYKNQVHLGL